MNVIATKRGTDCLLKQSATWCFWAHLRRSSNQQQYCLQVSLSCAVLCHMVSLQYLSRSSLHRLAGLPCRLFLSYGLQVVTRDVHRSSLMRLIYPAQDHVIVSHIAEHEYDWCPLPDPDVGLSILACDVEYTSFDFGLCGRKFVLCLFGWCLVHHKWHSWQHA